MTADARPAALQQGRDAGADAVLVKPVLPEVIFAEADPLIEQSRRLRSHHEEVDADVRRATERNRSLREASIQRRAHFRRETTHPPLPPPELECPRCAALLKYVRSFIGGVSETRSEQWDYFGCSSCGTFQYRHRTGKIRHIS